MSNVFIHPMVLEQDLVWLVEIETGMEARVTMDEKLILEDCRTPRLHSDFCGAGEYFTPGAA